MWAKMSFMSVGHRPVAVCMCASRSVRLGVGEAASVLGYDYITIGPIKICIYFCTLG